MSVTGETTEVIVRRSLAAVEPRVRDLILDAVRASKVEVGQLEASVRYHQEKGTVAGGRMMLEQAPRALAERILEAFAVPTPPLFSRLLDLAQDEGVPLITGWDLGAATPVAKLYVNASDLDETGRRRLTDRLRPEIGALPQGLGHVFGVNVGKGVVEAKCYQQSADFDQAACGLGPAARQLVDAVRDTSLAVGAVVAWDMRPGAEARRRAFFLAFRNAESDDAYPLLTVLSNDNVQALEAALPFKAGPITSIGTALEGARRITVYVRREPLDRWTVEPAAIYRFGSHEVAVFLDPATATTRAYQVTKHHRITFRTSGPEAPREVVKSLMRWVVAHVCLVEAPNSRLAFDRPPPKPWRQAR